jgi:hypothetical protein
VIRGETAVQPGITLALIAASTQMRPRLALLAAGAAVVAAAAPGGFTRPPIGWNAWFAYRQAANSSLIMATADALVRLGLRDAGYVYVNVDGGWAGGAVAGWAQSGLPGSTDTGAGVGWDSVRAQLGL